VDVRGLPTLFPYLAGTAKLPPGQAKTKQERLALEKEDDEHIANIVCTLFHELAGAYRQRLLGKFVEKEHAQVDRLISLRHCYLTRVDEFEAQYARSRVAPPDDEEEAAAEEEERFLGRLEAGEFTVQLCTAALAYLVVSGDRGLSKHVLLRLHDADVPLGDVVDTLRQMRASMGDRDDGSTVTNNTAKVEALHGQLSRLYERMKRS